MSITLESIKAEQSKITEMIAAFEKQVSTPRVATFPEIAVELAEGEEYAGLILGKDGEASYHLVLLPGDADDINWTNAVAWAKGQGGELPTRREQSLLFANLKSHFAERAYWPAEQYESNADYAWCQTFVSGFQLTTLKSLELRARAVRRLFIE